MDRQERAKIAQEHNKKILEKYPSQIIKCSVNTKTFFDDETNDFDVDKEINITNVYKNYVVPIQNKIALLDMDTVSAIIEMNKQRKNMCIKKSRCRFILDVAEAREIDVLILGAFGCGVFEQDPKEVVDIFLELLKNYRFKEVIFAVPSKINGKSSENYNIFKSEMEKYEKN